MVDDNSFSTGVSSKTTMVSPIVYTEKRIIHLAKVYKGMHAETMLVWHCDCGEKVEATQKYCSNCGNKLWQTN